MEFVEELLSCPLLMVPFTESGLWIPSLPLEVMVELIKHVLRLILALVTVEEWSPELVFHWVTWSLFSSIPLVFMVLVAWWLKVAEVREVSSETRSVKDSWPGMLLQPRIWLQEISSAEPWPWKLSKEEVWDLKRITFTCILITWILRFCTKDFQVLLKLPKSLPVLMSPKSQLQSFQLSTTTWVVFQPTTKPKSLKWSMAMKLLFLGFWHAVKQVLLQSMVPTDWVPTHCSIWLFSEELLLWLQRKSTSQARVSQICQRMPVKNQLQKLKTWKTAREQFQFRRSESKCKETCKETLLFTGFKKHWMKGAIKLTRFIKATMMFPSVTRVQSGTLTWLKLWSCRICWVIFDLNFSASITDSAFSRREKGIKRSSRKRRLPGKRRC